MITNVNDLSLLDAALHYAGRGWPVFPIRPGTKGGEGNYLTAHAQNDATTDAEQVRRWWTATPDANIGMHCQPGGLIGVDLDVKVGADGELEWKRWLAGAGLDPEAVERTWAQRTPSGGRHLLYAEPTRMTRNTQGRLGLGIDTRSNGYLVMAPSRTRYGAYAAECLVDPIGAPPALVAALRQPEPAPVERTGPVQLAAAPEVQRRVRQLADELAGAPDGAGNGTAARVAFMVGGYVGAGQLAHEEACAVLAGALDGWTFAPGRGTRDTMLRTIERQLREGARHPRPWGEATPATGGELVPNEHAYPALPGQGTPARRSRRVDLAPHLDGTYVAPEPSRGAPRDDGQHLLYPGRWHTVIGLTTAGKSWFGLWHAASEMQRGVGVVYLHFEEASPVGTLARMRALGCPNDLLKQRFVWLDCGIRWTPGELAAEIQALPGAPSLVVLDGINAACSLHGWPVDKPESVGAYRSMFVAPFAKLGAAVVSLGHPPKARDRQGERHGFGSTAWLDEVDGVGFRLEAGKQPIGRGREGSSALYVVKDRYGSVERAGKPQESRESGWTYLGQFVVDSSPGTWLDGADHASLRLAAPREDSEGVEDQIDALANKIVKVLDAGDGQFRSQRHMIEMLHAADVAFDKNAIGAAIERLIQAGHLARFGAYGACRSEPIQAQDRQGSDNSET